MANDQQLSYCADMVRRLDKDRFLTALFAPEPGRSHLMALYAFNLEVARTREQVSEPMIGEIRLQWWREALEAIEKGKPPEHEVVQALATAINETALDRSLLGRLIDARSFDLYDEPMETMDDLVRYLKDTSSVLMQAGVSILSASGGSSVDQATEKAGLAWGIAGVLRALPIHIERNQQFLPQDILKRHGVIWADASDSGKQHTVKPVISELTDLARQFLRDAKKASRESDGRIRPVLMPAAFAELYLRQIDKDGFNPCTTSPDVPVFRKQLTMMKVALFGRL